MSSTDPPQRKRVSQACQPCGAKKVKCDGVYPICSPCQNKGLRCTYGVSKRRTRVPGVNHGPRTLQARQSLSNMSPGGSEHVQTPGYHPSDAHAPELLQKSRVTLDMISGSASTSLLQTYFNCLHPLWPILYKPLYSSSDYANPTNMMAPPLVAAIFAIASCIDRPQQYTPNTIVGKFPEPTQFFEEALNLLQLVDENDRTPRLSRALTPSITNCQVLTILCLQQHGVAEYSRAAILCGLASAMAIELRIHRPCESEDPIQREIQSRLWWNLYILEKMMSTEMGRPVLLRAEESDCPFPSEQEADEFELMAARPGSQGALGTPSHLRSVPTKLRTISGLHTTIKLSQIFEKLAREIYGIKARKTIRENQAEGEAKRMSLWFALQGWEREMEGSALRLDLSRELSSVPAAVTNYVIMWHATILLHRPFIARWPSNPAAVDSTNPLEVCLQAANNICLVLEKYFDRLLGLPCDMIFSVFTAASMLLYQSKQSQDVNGENRRRLRLCVHWLSVFGKSWKSAGARHQLLSDMFDLPHHLSDQRPNNQVPGTSNDQPQTPQPGPQSSWTAVSHHPASEASTSAPHTAATQSPDDWTFLRDFGDPTDEFYELDVQLRGLLDGGFDAAAFNFNGQMA
ncbi:related to CHA4-transcription factor [Phialocephala subalpina]|uniref:Related to CHA4-transcription factor n=1 Tax=Phialocephala subalpina TaxID=576137 RepID=A0A1L7XY15_9HELO|nr:related to CHA4-transcription factor [Phialocephala subalpina]